ncbi:MAG: hypothetical protein DRJ65_22790 [Acidobacteria bacterium]|nr:MAG: hypothetical protein DRJ65_22790 [Acidobacteriota bacterium]
MKRLMIIVLVAAAGLAVSTPLWASGHSAPMVIPAAAFHNDGEDPNGFYFNQNGYLEGDGTGVKMFAGAHLPQGATVESLTLYAVDGTDACDLPSVTAWLFRVPVGEAQLSEMVGVATDGASSAIQEPTSSSITDGVIDNLFYRYFVRVDFCAATHKFLAVAIDYSE